MAQMPGAFKQVQDLGSPLEVYPLRNALVIRGGGLLLIAACILGGLAVAGVAGWNAYVRYYHHGPAVIWRGLVWPLVLAALLWGVGIFAASGIARRWKKTLALYERGLAVRGPDGLSACPWGDVASLRIDIARRTFAGVPLSSSRRISLVRSDGERFTIDGDIREMDTALEKIRARLLPVLYERYAPEFENGQAFVFGPIELQKDRGVGIKPKWTSWQALQKAGIDQGRLRLAASEPNGNLQEVSIPVADIPNLDLLMAFIQQMKPAV